MTSSFPAEPPPRVRLFNGCFDALTLQQCVQRVFEDVDRGRRGWLATVNVAILMMMRQDPQLQRFVDDACWTVADGQPIVWVSRWFGRPLPERVTGVDLVDALCERALARGEGVYCLGATREVLERVLERLRAQHPGLRVDGADGYFSPEEAQQRAERVAASGAKLLLVGMGVPRQERFIASQWQRLGVNVAVGVGGSFDVMAGLRRRAPRWMQAVGLEWFYRLIQEPRRLWRRYLVTGLQFVGLVARAAVWPRDRDR